MLKWNFWQKRCQCSGGEVEMKVQRPRLHHYMLLLYDSRGCINILLTISVCNVLENIDHKCFTGVLIENTPLAIFSVLGFCKEVRWQSDHIRLFAGSTCHQHLLSSSWRGTSCNLLSSRPPFTPELLLLQNPFNESCQKKFTSTEIFLVGWMKTDICNTVNLLSFFRGEAH